MQERNVTFKGKIKKSSAKGHLFQSTKKKFITMISHLNENMNSRAQR